MGITSSVIVEDALQAHGQRYVREVHTDHLGREWWYSYAAENKADVNAIMAGRVSHVEAMLKEREIVEIVGKVEEGGTVPKTLQFATALEVKAALVAAKAERDAEIAELEGKAALLDAEAKK